MFFRNCPGMAWFLIPFQRAGREVVFLGVWWGTVRVVGWLLVENCTVDASIFVFCRLSYKGRTVDALASGADEGRGRPR